MGEVSDLLQEATQSAVSGDHGALEAAIKRVFQQEYEDNLTTFVSIRPFTEAWHWFSDRIRPAIRKIGPATDPRRVANWLGTAVVNAAKVAAQPEGAKAMWLSRRDDRVRPTHVEADGQTVKWGEPFHVCGQEMLFPGEPVGDPACWLNCRCVVAEASLFTMSKEAVMTAVGLEDDLEDQDWMDDIADEEWDDDDDGELVSPTVQWHGVLAPEGVQSGDRRSFSPGALTWRDLPLPLRRQPTDTGGHDGAVVVAIIEHIRREGPLVRAAGTFMETPEADDVIGLMAEGGAGGISVDVDDAELASDAGDNVEFGKGRICAATIVDIPAFAEAFIALGPDPDQPPETDLIEASLDPDDFFFAISEKPWDGSASRFTPEEYKRSCVLHRSDSDAKSEHSLPIREPNGDLNRAGVHAAAARLNQVDATPAQKSAAKSALRAAYRQLGEDPPESLTSSGEELARGPGWVTNPKETRRIHAYWTKPGHKGYAKIRWGTPGDFRRLRRALSKYVSPTYLNRVAAQWHHDALGYWPGECGRPGNPPCGKRRHGLVSDAVTLAASADAELLPTEWFTDPGLEQPTPLTVEGRRVYGHLATFGTCHIGISGICTTPPHSTHNYAYFATGSIPTIDGRVSVGQITMDTGHAELSSGHRGAKHHYDFTGSAVADVACGEDECGIWVAGALRPGVTEEQVHALQAGALSGDWRAIGGDLELVAALVVNVPGFPIPRTSLAASGGMQTALVAAGVCTKPPVDLVVAVADEVEARVARRRRAAEVRKTLNAERVTALAAAMGTDGD